MKIQDLRKKNLSDLEKMSQDLRIEIVQSKLDAKSSKETNVRKSRNLRKDLSRVLTLMTHKTNEAATVADKKEDK